MELALYHPEHGYYARADRRSGRAGDFFTSVDVGPVFGELLAKQLDEMWWLIRSPDAESGGPDWFDLVEAGAGSGRLARDVLDAAQLLYPRCYAAMRLHLVERSPAARAAQHEVLGPHVDRLASAATALPNNVIGVIYANELLDALPTHLVSMAADGLRELYVDAVDGQLVEREGPLSTAALSLYFEKLAITLPPGGRAEVCLAAANWIAHAATCLTQGFVIVIDYGHTAAELYSASHASGTLRTFHRHTLDTAPQGTAPWLADPGGYDITAHLDLTTVSLAAEAAGLELLAALDQTYFLLGLGAADTLTAADSRGVDGLKRRLGVKTLLLPGGLGSTHKVLIFGKGVGRPVLKGASYKVRMT